MTINTGEFKEYDFQEEKKYIAERLERQEVTRTLTIDLMEAVSQSVDAVEEFIEKMHDEQIGYSTDDEMEYIMQKTGLKSEFVDLLLWYKMCYEMEQDMWIYASESCLACGGGPLHQKEIPGEDYASKIVCQKCGEEMMEGENGLLVENDDNLAIVKDFDQFCQFIDANNPPLSKKKEVLGKKDAFNLNNLLHFKREVTAPNYQQDQYYGLDLLFNLALTGGLYRKVVGDSGKITLQRTERLDSYVQLNDYEKYVFLLETYWCNYDIKKMYQGFSAYNSVNLVRNLLIAIAKSNRGERLGKELNELYRYIDSCFSFDFKIVVRFSCFGFCNFEWNEEAKSKYDDMIKTIIPTGLGRKASSILVTEGMEYFKHAEEFSHLPDMGINKQKNKSKKKLTFYQLLAEIFPAGAVQKTVAEASREKVMGAYVFKVALTNKVWRKIKLSSRSTLEDLHLAIQDAFQFDNDHLYAFYLNEGNKPIMGAESREFEQGPFTDELVLEECSLYPGKQFSYLFDFGDMWKFKISLLEIDETGSVPLKHEIIESKGDAPDQYPWYE